MMHDGNWHERQQERIADDYGEPACEVVRVMHWDLRVPLCHVARALYVSEQTIREWCRDWGLPTRHGGYVKVQVPGKVQLRARLLGYESVPQAVGALRAEGLQWEEIKLRLKCADSTLSRYYPDSAKGHYILSDAGRAVKQAVARRLNERRRPRMPDLCLVSPHRERAN